MNVHRRERARLRESPSGELPYSRRNPNCVLLLNLNSEPERTYDGVEPPSHLSLPVEAFCSELNYSKNRNILKEVEEVSKKRERPEKDSTGRTSNRKNGDRAPHLETRIETTVKENVDLDLRLGYA